jgi:hypothetical protein
MMWGVAWGVAWETEVIYFSLGRQKHEAELDKLVGAWCAGKDAAAEAADLGARGVCPVALAVKSFPSNLVYLRYRITKEISWVVHK